MVYVMNGGGGVVVSGLILKIVWSLMRSLLIFGWKIEEIVGRLVFLMDFSLDNYLVISR